MEPPTTPVRPATAKEGYVTDVRGTRTPNGTQRPDAAIADMPEDTRNCYDEMCFDAGAGQTCCVLLVR